MDDRVKLKVMGITYSQIQNGAYALVLAEENGDRRIPIIIGTAEAQSIAHDSRSVCQFRSRIRNSIA
mgnify:CR=1 FL=1